MSIKLMNLVWKDHTGELSGIEKAILIRMADFAADNGTQIFPSVKFLALETGFAERTIRRAINTLIEKKRLSKTIRSRKTVHISNLYRINVSVLEQKATPRKQSTKNVNKPVDKPCINEGGTVTQTGGVLSDRPGGTVCVTAYPPYIHHYDPPTAKQNNNCSKNEQDAKMSLESKQQMMKECKKLLAQMSVNRSERHYRR